MLHTNFNHANDFLNQSIIFDGQLGFEPKMPLSWQEKWQIIDRYTQTGFNCVTLSIANDESTPEQTIEYLAKLLVHINQSEKYKLAITTQDIITAKHQNKIALRLMFQGTSPIGKDINMVDLYHQLGISSMILCYNIRTPIGDGCIESNDCGLSHLGKKLINQMNRVGMIIDCSHTGYRTSMDALELSTKPVIFSHSNVYKLNPNIRNVKDEQIKAVAKTKGIIGVNGIGLLLGDESANPKKLVKHINYIAELVGPEYISLGLDYLYFSEDFNNFMQDQTITHPQAYGEVVKTVSKSIQPEQISEIVELLIKNGYSKHEIDGILGLNYFRVVDLSLPN